MRPMISPAKASASVSIASLEMEALGQENKILDDPGTSEFGFVVGPCSCIRWTWAGLEMDPGNGIQFCLHK